MGSRSRRTLRKTGDLVDPMRTTSQKLAAPRASGRRVGSRAEDGTRDHLHRSPEAAAEISSGWSLGSSRRKVDRTSWPGCRTTSLRDSISQGSRSDRQFLVGRLCLQANEMLEFLGGLGDSLDGLCFTTAVEKAHIGG